MKYSIEQFLFTTFRCAMILYRPVGLNELEAIAASGYRTFPPRPLHQPIFYPVLSREHADQIARNWNQYDPTCNYAGFVVAFEIDDEYASRFEIHVAGNDKSNRELWVPADQLEEFNSHIIDRISVETVHYGPHFTGSKNFSNAVLKGT